MVKAGSGANALGDPNIALAWLANELCGLGIRPKKGQTVATCACIQPPGTCLAIGHEYDGTPGTAVQGARGAV
jgi:2-keto-4-pentenoate hydratase